MPLPPKILWKRTSKSESLSRGHKYYFSQSRADHAVGFFEQFLTHSKGQFAGQPFTLLDWQREEVIEELFGWLRVDNDYRRYRQGYICLPKKNGKSTLLSGIGLYLLVSDNEPAAEVYGCATSRDQASIVAKQMFELVRASPLLSRRLEIIESRKTIACIPTNSFYRVISSDSTRAEGLNIHGLLYDELHSAKDRRLYDATRYGGAARMQSLSLAITTAGVSRDTICWEQHEYATHVSADPAFDPTFFPYIRAANLETDDYRSPEVWRAANPSWGITMDEESFANDVREAERSTSKLASFLRYRLNCWVQSESKFIDLSQWEKCKAPAIGIDDPRREWYCGLDLAQTWDLNAFVGISLNEDNTWDVICKFWMPDADIAERSAKEGADYSRWSKHESETGLCLTPGNACDYEFIRRDIVSFCRSHNVRRIAVDPHNSHYLAQQLQAESIEVIGFQQSYGAFNQPTRNLEVVISQARLRTSDNPILNFMVANATVRSNSDGYIKVVKPAPNSTQKIDGVIALIMALAVAGEATTAGLVSPEIFTL